MQFLSYRRLLPPSKERNPKASEQRPKGSRRRGFAHGSPTERCSGCGVRAVRGIDLIDQTWGSLGGPCLDVGCLFGWFYDVLCCVFEAVSLVSIETPMLHTCCFSVVSIF